MPAGQTVQFTILASGSCPTPGTYMVRADIIDPATSQVESTDQAQLMINAQFSTTFSESVVAPSEVGPWRLQLNVYVLAGGVPVAPNSEDAFGLQVVPYTATSSIPPISVETSSTMSSPATSLATMNTSTQTQTQSQSTSTAPPPQSESNDDLVTEVRIATAIFAAMLLIIFILKRRQQRVRRDQTQVY